MKSHEIRRTHKKHMKSYEKHENSMKSHKITRCLLLLYINACGERQAEGTGGLGALFRDPTRCDWTRERSRSVRSTQHGGDMSRAENARVHMKSYGFRGILFM